MQNIIPIPDKNLPNTCEDFVARQGDAVNAGQEGPLESGRWPRRIAAKDRKDLAGFYLEWVAVYCVGFNYN
ncbi:MAG: hypothetical protein FWE42_07625 [Defluviitaleaceae bacterium]|nr:hypothetical protein [Defluviitaleaceae bacterium]